MNKTNTTTRTPQQIEANKLRAERIMSRPTVHKALGRLSMDGIISNTGIMYDDIKEGAKTVDAIATDDSESAWKAIMPEVHAGNQQMRILGKEVVGQHIEIQSISTEQTIPVNVQHAAAA